jgi:hypothetical protein
VIKFCKQQPGCLQNFLIRSFERPPDLPELFGNSKSRMLPGCKFVMREIIFSYLYGQPFNDNNLTGALPHAPVLGRWFQAQFVQLVQNAYPPFP